MSTTVNFPVTKDARIANRTSDNWNAGSGASTGLPFGLYNGYRYRVLLGFSINMSGWTNIVSATLNYRSSNQINVAFGADPDILWQRITGAWSEGSSDGLSASNAVIWPGPAVTTTNQTFVDVPTTEGTWGVRDITAMMRDVLNGQPFQGIRGMAYDGSGESNSSTDVGEFFSREYGSAAYISITYDTNRAPNAPTVSSPSVSNGLSGTTTPTLDFLLSDPDGNTLTSYQWRIDDNSDYSSPLQNVQVPGSYANNSHQTVVPTALTRGVTYYVSAQAYDGQAWGPWGTSLSFKVASLPTVTVSEPSAAGRLAKMTYTPGSGWTVPRMVVNWDVVCPDGGTQQSARIEVAVDSAGSPGGTYEDVTVNDAVSRSYTTVNPLTEGAYYHVRVTGTCSHGLSAVVAYRRVRARWGVVTHRYDTGVTPKSLNVSVLDVTDETNGGQGRVVVEYATTPTATAPTTWSGTIGGAGLNQNLWYRAWLLAWGASPAVSPTLNEIKLTYDIAQLVPDNWVRTDVVNQSGDPGAYVYGTKSYRMLGKGSSHAVSQLVAVNPNTDYILSGRVQSNGNSGAYIALSSSATGPDLAATTAKTASVAFEEDTPAKSSKVATAVWNSGSNTSVYVRLVMSGAVGTTAWFDALKLEASVVVTPWSPGYIAPAVILDAGGIQIDATNGGVFRLRGSAGGTRDTVALGVNGLLFGGDTELSSPSTGVLSVGGAVVGTPPGGIIAYGGAAAPTGWLFCRGQSLLRTDYPALFTAIGTAYGSVDGTHFTLPDLQAKFPMGAGGGQTLGFSGGSFSHNHTYTQVISHSHTVTMANTLGNTSTSPASSVAQGGSSARFGADIGGTTTNPASTATGTVSTFTDAPPYAVVNYLIKT